MFRQPDFSNLRFNIIQAVNPYIQNSSNKCYNMSGILRKSVTSLTSKPEVFQNFGEILNGV